jgi:hypothetical protein
MVKEYSTGHAEEIGAAQRIPHTKRNSLTILKNQALSIYAMLQFINRYRDQ